jgi:hypothetical protein
MLWSWSTKGTYIWVIGAPVFGLVPPVMGRNMLGSADRTITRVPPYRGSSSAFSKGKIEVDNNRITVVRIIEVYKVFFLEVSIIFSSYRFVGDIYV